MTDDVSLKDMFYIYSNRTPIEEIREVLFVDETSAIKNNIASVLRMNDFNVTQVNTGQQCLRNIETSEYDAILIGPKIEGISTREVVSLIRSFFEKNEIRVFCVLPPKLKSKELVDEFIQDMKESGADGIITPYTANAIVERLTMARNKLKKKKVKQA